MIIGRRADGDDDEFERIREEEPEEIGHRFHPALGGLLRLDTIGSRLPDEEICPQWIREDGATWVYALESGGLRRTVGRADETHPGEWEWVCYDAQRVSNLLPPESDRGTAKSLDDAREAVERALKSAEAAVREEKQVRMAQARRGLKRL